VCGIRWRFSISCGVVSVGAEGMSTLQRTVRANQAQRLHVRVEDSLLKTVKVARLQKYEGATFDRAFEFDHDKDQTNEKQRPNKGGSAVRRGVLTG
jgi:hypothetical protein